MGFHCENTRSRKRKTIFSKLETRISKRLSDWIGFWILLYNTRVCIFTFLLVNRLKKKKRTRLQINFRPKRLLGDQDRSETWRETLFVRSGRDLKREREKVAYLITFSGQVDFSFFARMNRFIYFSLFFFFFLEKSDTLRLSLSTRFANFIDSPRILVGISKNNRPT